MSYQAVHPHEMGAFWHFADPEHGLSPYWTVSKLCHQHFDGYADLEFTHEGREYRLQLNYNDETGIAPRSEDPVDAERLYEYKIRVESQEDEAHASFDLSPRFDGMTHPDGHELENNLGWPHDRDGVDIHVQGANLWPWEYQTLLLKALQTLADEAGIRIRRDYFQTILPSSSIYELEAYVRLTRDMFKKLVRSDGIFYRVMHLLADETGTSWVYSADNTEVLGYRHEMKLGVGAARELLPALSSGVVLKGYHPKHVRAVEDEDDPLSFPAFRAKLHQQQNDGESFEWDTAWERLRDIQEIVTNVLSWADIPSQPDATTFVADDHFEIGASEFDVERFSDPTPGLEAEQEHVLLSVLDDLTPSGKAVAKHLATDGGSHVQDIADEQGYSVRQIYRAVEHMGDAVELDNGQVQFVSEKLRQEVQAIAERMENAVESWATRAAEIVDLELRQSADSALEKWLAKYGAKIEPPDGDEPARIRFDTVLSAIRSRDVPRLSDVLAEGLDAWMSAGRNPQTFRDFRYAAEKVLEGDDVGKVNPNLR